MTDFLPSPDAVLLNGKLLMQIQLTQHLDLLDQIPFLTWFKKGTKTKPVPLHIEQSETSGLIVLR
jgi:hypothetical protein